MTLTRWLTVVGVVVVLGVPALPLGADQGRGQGGRQGRGYSRGYPPRPVYGSGYGGPRPRYGYPYYAFRPRVNVGLGLWAGYPVPFPGFGFALRPFPYGYPSPYALPVPVPYAAPYAVPYGAPYPLEMYPAPGGYPPFYPPYSPYGPYSPSYGAYAPGAGATVAPGLDHGGVSLEITPDGAGVFIDGAYAGPVGHYGPMSGPLSLTPGSHRVEVRAPGYHTLAFDVAITPGQVVPFRGALTPE